jgi:hypothetical protein
MQPVRYSPEGVVEIANWLKAPKNVNILNLDYDLRDVVANSPDTYDSIVASSISKDAMGCPYINVKMHVEVELTQSEGMVSLVCGKVGGMVGKHTTGYRLASQTFKLQAIDAADRTATPRTTPHDAGESGFELYAKDASLDKIDSEDVESLARLLQEVIAADRKFWGHRGIIRIIDATDKAQMRALDRSKAIWAEIRQTLYDWNLNSNSLGWTSEELDVLRAMMQTLDTRASTVPTRRATASSESRHAQETGRDPARSWETDVM